MVFAAVITPKEKAIDFPREGGGEIVLEIPTHSIDAYLPMIYLHGEVLRVTLIEDES